MGLLTGGLTGGTVLADCSKDNKGVLMNATLTDAEQIAQKIRGYIQGCETGDGVHFKAAFHPDARMFGHVGPDRYDEPIFGGMDVFRPRRSHDLRLPRLRAALT